VLFFLVPLKVRHNDSVVKPDCSLSRLGARSDIGPPPSWATSIKWPSVSRNRNTPKRLNECAHMSARSGDGFLGFRSGRAVPYTSGPTERKLIDGFFLLARESSLEVHRPFFFLGRSGAGARRILNG